MIVIIRGTGSASFAGLSTESPAACYFFCFLDGRRVTIFALLNFFLFRVLYPSAGLPHGVFGCFKPIEFRASPPPCGWSQGFITLPRTVGLQPMCRRVPAFPWMMFEWSALLTTPIVA